MTTTGKSDAFGVTGGSNWMDNSTSPGDSSYNKSPTLFTYEPIQETLTMPPPEPSVDETPLYERMKDPAFGLDDGIRDAVVLLNQHGIDTYESCEGGAGHTYTEPTVAFSDDGSKGMHALGICIQHGLPVSELQQAWQIDRDSTIHQVAWRIVFYKKVYYGRGEPDDEQRFLRGRTIMRAYANDITSEQWQQIKTVLDIGSIND